MRRAACLALTALALTVCSGGSDLPKGVDEEKLYAEISSAIGDPNTCVLIGRQGAGEVVYRYNSHTTCGRSLPSCQGAATRTVDDLLKATAKSGEPVATSCSSVADNSRGVGWASGALTGKGQGLVYAAVMEGERSFPGMMMNDRLSRAMKDAGL
jgi:hypothetical protein